MSKDIFNRDQTITAGAFTSDRLVMTVSSGGSSWVNALVQQFTANYSQEFREIPELGSNNVYRVLGRPKGRMQLGRIIAKNMTLVDKALFDACNVGGTMSLSGDVKMCQGGGNVITATISMTFNGIFVVNYGVSATAEELFLRENVELIFTGMEKT